MTEQVSNLDHKNKLNNLNKGYKLYKLERYEDALKEFDRAVAINEVIIPKDNERDLAEIPEEIKKALVIHPVSYASEILEIVFKTQK